MEQRMDPPAPVAAPFARMVAEALVLSRQIAQLSLADYAQAMSFLLRREVSEGQVAQAETGMEVPADYLLAAGRISTSPVSFLLGEWEYDDERLDRLEALLEDLRALSH